MFLFHVGEILMSNLVMTKLVSDCLMHVNTSPSYPALSYYVDLT